MLPARPDAKAILDYIDFLLKYDRPEDARVMLDAVHPANPAQTNRLAQLRLWAVNAGNKAAGEAGNRANAGAAA